MIYIDKLAGGEGYRLTITNATDDILAQSKLYRAYDSAQKALKSTARFCELRAFVSQNRDIDTDGSLGQSWWGWEVRSANGQSVIESRAYDTEEGADMSLKETTSQLAHVEVEIMRRVALPDGQGWKSQRRDTINLKPGRGL